MRKRLAIAVICAFLVITVVFALSACKGGAVAKPDSVTDFSISKQLSGDVTYTNYQVTVKNDADWDTMSSSDREKIIDYAFYQARQDMTANNVIYYNVTGVGEYVEGERGQTLFMYDKQNDQVVIYANGQETDKIAAP